MSNSIPQNNSNLDLMVEPKKSGNLKRYIIPVFMAILIILWELLNHLFGVLAPLPWMEKWGEAMLILGIGLWLLFLLIPAITRFSRRNKWLKAGVPLILLAGLLIIPLIHLKTGTLNYWLYMLTICFLYIIWSSSWNIIGGFAGYISLGHNVFTAVGAYFSGMIFVFWQISPFITAPIAGIFAMVGGLLFGLIALRTRGSAFIISTIALVLLVLEVLDTWKLTGGTNGLAMPMIRLDGALAKIPFYYYMLAIMLLCIFMTYLIKHSKFGLGLRAISQDETKAEVAGIPTRKYKILAFGLSGLFIGMSGAVYGYSLTYLRPSIFLTVAIGTGIVLNTILGGKGTVSGPVIGAAIMLAVNEFVVSKLGATELNIVVTGLILIFVLLFFPDGIVGSLRNKGILPTFLDWD
ncbi:MAG: branched-chain amino acid ABC transporter permease [Chloroflexi bacterium]|nr:branched-chain amino acid ABC transporter permease [Chloroflexota bacterium]